MSFAPNDNASWPIFGPCVTHDDCTLATLSRYSRAMAWVRKYSNAPAGADGVKVHLGEAAAQVAQQLLVPLQLQRRVVAALHQDLVAAQRDRLLDLLVQLLARQDVGVGVGALAVEGAEVADRGADVG